MNKLTAVTGATAIVLLLSLAWLWHGPVAAQEKPARPVPTWEYKQVNVLPAGVSDMEARLNQLGSEGWELGATVAPVARGTDESTVSFILKRPKR